MALIGSAAATRFVEILEAPETGVPVNIAQLAADSGIELPPASVIAQNVKAEIAERVQAVKYPVIHVYVDKIQNRLTEKFRTFSGKVKLVAEIRVSQDRVEEVESRLRLYVEAVTQVLDQNRGDWGQGAFFSGGYEVSFEAVRHGGLNLLQAAKVGFEIDVSV
jgi:hypothetical protein